MNGGWTMEAAVALVPVRTAELADEVTFVFDYRMAGYGVEPTPECPSDGAGECGFMAGKRLSMSVAVRLANWAVLPEWRILNSCAGVVLTQRDAQAMARPRRNSAAFVADRVEGDVASGHSLSSLAQVCVIATKDFPIAIRRTGSDANRILGCAKRFESHGYAL